jgi:hypothetical protein
MMQALCTDLDRAGQVADPGGDTDNLDDSFTDDSASITRPE